MTARHALVPWEPPRWRAGRWGPPCRWGPSGRPAFPRALGAENGKDGCGERRDLRRCPPWDFGTSGESLVTPPPHQPVHGGAGEGLGVSPSTPSPQVALAVLVGWPRG